MSEDSNWIVSSTCADGNNCVEVQLMSGGAVAVRDGKDRRGPVLTFTAEEWAMFLAGAREGDFDRRS
jgi:myosin-crossreactive antigen